MPTIQNPTLSMTRPTPWTGLTFEVTVTYLASFSPVEVFLLANGLQVQERVHLYGDDEAATGRAPLFSTPAETVTPVPGTAQVTRTRQLTLSRSQLDEDPGTEPVVSAFGASKFSRPAADEVLARIELSYVGLDQQTSADSRIATLAW